MPRKTTKPVTATPAKAKKTNTKTTAAKAEPKATSKPARTTAPEAVPTVPVAVFVDFLSGLRDLCDAYLSSVSGTDLHSGKKTSTKAKAAPEPDEDDGGQGTDDDLRAELEKLSDAGLRQRVLKAGYSKKDVAGADRETLIVTLIDAANSADSDDEDEDEDEDTDGYEDTDNGADEDGDGEDEDGDSDDEDDEGDEYTREELLGMGIKELKSIIRDAAEENDEEVPDMKGWDKDTLADYILGEGDDDEDEGDEDEDGEPYTEEDYEEMNEKELRVIANEAGVKLKPTDKKAAIIRKLLA